MARVLKIKHGHAQEDRKNIETPTRLQSEANPFRISLFARGRTFAKSKRKSRTSDFQPEHESEPSIAKGLS